VSVCPSVPSIDRAAATCSWFAAAWARAAYICRRRRSAAASGQRRAESRGARFKRDGLVVIVAGADSPRITLAPRDQRVMHDGVASFFCKASGNPAPDVYWRKAGRRITTGRQRYDTVELLCN